MSNEFWLAELFYNFDYECFSIRNIIINNYIQPRYAKVKELLENDLKDNR